MQKTALREYGFSVDKEVIEDAAKHLEKLDGNILVVTYDYWDHRVIDTYFTRELYKTKIDTLRHYTDISDFKIDLDTETVNSGAPPEHNPCLSLSGYEEGPGHRFP